MISPQSYRYTWVMSINPASGPAILIDPAASVSGWYFSHPDAFYFGLGKINADQVADYATRKGMTVEEVERWLKPNLCYDPQERN